MRYTDQLLDTLRQAGDPEAEAIVAALAREGELESVNQLLRSLLYNEQPVPEALPDRVEAWLRETCHLPEGADRRRLDRMSELFVQHGMVISLILATASLVECYAAVTGVKVLTYTYRLGKNPYQRIAETAQWVLLVMAPGGLGEGGQGIRATQKIRLMHAAIRHLIRQTGRWDEAAHGVPICQEDQLGTLMAFSYVVLRDLRKLGFDVRPQQAEDYLYGWTVIGQLLGLRPDVLPGTMAEAQELTEAIYRRHHGPSPEGVAMTHALLEMFAQLTPGKALDGVMPAMVRHLVGDRVADWMEVPFSSWHGAVRRYAHLMGRADRLRRAAGPMGDLAARLGFQFLTAQAFAGAGWRRAGFAIPTRLRDAWGLGAGGGDA